MRLTTAIVLMFAAMGATAQAADIKILCSNGFQAVMRELGPQYEQKSGNHLVIRYGLAGPLAKDIENGESFDLAILAPPQVDALILANKIAADSRVILARSPIGVMVKSGAPKPDISSVDAFKRTMLAAKSIAYAPQGQSGIYLVGLFERLGIAGALKDKLVPIASGPLTGETVAKGGAEIGMTPIGELLAVKGVDLVGPLPPDIRHDIIQTAGVGHAASQAAAARDFLNFLKAPANAHIIVEKGMEPG
jgi:molybdate transport system substrate-binding protein